MSENLPPAYTFRSDVTRKELQAKLNEMSSWKWLGGDSEYDGLYLRARPTSGTKLRILGEVPPSYTIEIQLNPALVEGLTINELHQIVIDELLPSIGATNVTPVLE
jgi:hypothetical protein